MLKNWAALRWKQKFYTVWNEVWAWRINSKFKVSVYSEIYNSYGSENLEIWRDMQQFHVEKSQRMSGQRKKR